MSFYQKQIDHHQARINELKPLRDVASGTERERIKRKITHHAIEKANYETYMEGCK